MCASSNVRDGMIGQSVFGRFVSSGTSRPSLGGPPNCFAADAYDPRSSSAVSRRGIHSAIGGIAREVQSRTHAGNAVADPPACPEDIAGNLSRQRAPESRGTAKRAGRLPSKGASLVKRASIPLCYKAGEGYGFGA